MTRPWLLAGFVTLVVATISRRTERIMPLSPDPTVVRSQCGDNRGWVVSILQTTAQSRHATAKVDQARGRMAIARARVTLIALVAERWCRERGHGRYPTTLAELLDQRAVSQDSVEIAPARQCVLTADLAVDPWDSPIYFEARERQLLIVSAGPDRIFTTDDDISLPDSALENTVVLDPETQCPR